VKAPLNQHDDPQLDQMMSQHLSAELEQHVGGALAKFEQAIGPIDRPAMKLADSAPRHASQWSARLWWAAPIVAAAAAVAMVVVPAMKLMSRDDANKPAGPSIVKSIPNEIAPILPRPGVEDPSDDGAAQATFASHDPNVEGSLFWQYRDAGKVYLDDQTVARRLVKTEFQRLEWTDPTDRTRVQITVPRQEVVLVSSPKF
jgi:hypothetical protein